MSANSKNAKHLPALDGVRGLAVLIVVAYHTGGGAQSSNPIVRTIGEVLKAGWSGVTLFFLLSGFLITGILWDTKGAIHWWRNFYMRRVLRISPLYYGALLLIALVALVTHRFRSGTTGLWVFALYLQNIPWITDPGQDLRPLPLSHFWSLAVEEQFYLVWPLLLRRLRTITQAKYLCLGVFLASAVFRYLVWSFSSDPGAYNGFILSRAGELALGGYLAMCFRDESWSRLERIAPFVAALSLAGFTAIGIANRAVELTFRSGDTAGLVCITLFYASLMVLTLKPGRLNHAMSVPWLRWVGKVSYGIYVFHVLLMPVFGWLALRLAPHASRIEGIALKALIVWLLTPLIAWLSYRFFESPILNLRRHFQSRPPTAANPS